MNSSAPGRATPARAALLVKVQAIEELVSSGNANGEWYPKKVRELVEWQNLDAGIRSWSSFSVAAINGPNADLRRRFDIAVAALERRGSPKRRAPHRSPDHAQALAEVKGLAEQNVRLLADREALARQIIRLEQRIAAMQARELELIGKLNRILPLDQQQRAFHPD